MVKRNGAAAAAEESRHASVSPPPSKRLKSSATSQAVKSFFTPTSQKTPDKLSWRTVNGTLLVGQYNALDGKDGEPAGAPKRRKIAAFDFDSTLISTSSGNIFGKSASDWKWWHGSVPGRLRSLHQAGYQLAIVSNQGGLSLAGREAGSGKARRLAEFKEKVGLVLASLGVPRVSLYAATGRDAFRKPRPGMWAELLRDCGLVAPAAARSDDVAGGENGEAGEGRDGKQERTDVEASQVVVVDLEQSFFVGDAAGRLARKGAKADFSCGDRDFASNVGITFHTPEEYFLGQEGLPWKRTFDPLQYVDQATAVKGGKVDDGSGTPSEETIITDAAAAATGSGGFAKKHDRELVVLVGSPGSGKSSFYSDYLEPLGYGRANQDQLKTRERCVKAARAMLVDERRPVAVDNTNADEATRADWVGLARECGVPVRCVWLQAPPEVCRHNDAVRALGGQADGGEGGATADLFNPEKRAMLPGMAFQGYASRFKEPRVEEGFDELIKVPFRFRGSEAKRAVWTKHWT